MTFTFLYQPQLDCAQQIEPKNIERLLRSQAFLTSYQRVSKDHGLTLPLKFASHLEELNFVSIMSLLNFASGYRVPLHTQTGRGAWDNIRALCFGLYITSAGADDLLSAKGMQSVDVAKIAELMGINLHIEKPHAQISGLIVGELGGPLYELVKLITQALNETGKILVSSGYPNLGAFVAEALKDASRGQSNNVAQVEIILEKVRSSFISRISFFNAFYISLYRPSPLFVICHKSMGNVSFHFYQTRQVMLIEYLQRSTVSRKRSS